MLETPFRSARRALIAALFIFTVLTAAATPEVKEVDAPELFTTVFGQESIAVTVRYGPQNEGEDLVTANAIRPENLSLTLTTAQNPDNKDLQLEPIWADVYSEDGQTIIVTYVFSLPGFQTFGPQHAGTYTLELLADEVYSEDLSPDPVKTYIPAQVLATFDLGLRSPPQISLRGRLWFETGEPSFTDDQHEVDPGIEDWGMAIDRKAENGEWGNTYFFDETDTLGRYAFSNITPGEYRVYPIDLIPEFATQALGDPQRNGELDGTLHFTVTEAMDGDTLYLNFPYIRKAGPPDALHDQYTVLYGSSETVFPVLANDVGNGLRITHLSDYQTTLDFGGRQSMASRGSSIRTNGKVVYYEPGPGAFGWELFWYRIEDNAGNTAINRVFILVANNLPFSLAAVDDIGYTTRLRPFLDIDVLANDIILSPHTRDGAEVRIDSATTPAGASITVFGSIIRYTPDPDFLGQDSFSYTLASQEQTSTATVTIDVTEVRANVTPRVEGLAQNLKSVLSRSLYGAWIIGLIEKHLPEAAAIVQQGPAISAMIASRDTHESADDILTLGLLKVFVDPFVDGAGQFLTGDGDNVTLTPLMATSIEGVINTLELNGSPELRADIKREREAMGEVQQYVGKSFNEIAAETLDLSPDDLFVPIAETRLAADGLHVSTFNTQGHVFTLWKADRPDATEWMAVPQPDEPAEDDVLRTLIDPKPGDGHAFYRLSAALEQDAPAR